MRLALAAFLSSFGATLFVACGGSTRSPCDNPPYLECAPGAVCVKVTSLFPGTVPDGHACFEPCTQPSDCPMGQDCSVRATDMGTAKVCQMCPTPPVGYCWGPSGCGYSLCDAGAGDGG
jgi:hypothetical protein